MLRVVVMNHNLLQAKRFDNQQQYMPLIHFCWEEIGYSVFSASSLDPQKPERRCLPKRNVLVLGDEPRGGVQWMWICHPSCIGIGHHRSEASTSVAAPSSFVTPRSISLICSSWLIRSRTLHVLGFLVYTVTEPGISSGGVGWLGCCFGFLG